jgi:LuxR family transcriptional regulator, maltose regulon positive regulatory protein
MTQLLLSTKLYFPRARSKIVSRPRLMEKLSAGLYKPLTLISAPAGYGKTTLLSDWRLRFGSDYPLAWLSLDPGDNNLACFLTYVAAALEKLDPRLPQDLVSHLYLPQLAPMEVLITTLINGVDAFPQEFALVLDDCHTITEPAIHDALDYLLGHLPPKMHLVMLTRADPPIHLAKLRVRGDLVELRTDDLRFTTEEATVFLNTVMDLNLSDENVSALDQRTEGWIVGLQMAALTMQGKEEPADFIKAFTGSNRYILDFLSEEVIQHQPKTTQTFLLHTSILDRLSGSLCDAVLGEAQNSAQLLVELERKNLFLIPLDNERQWYRYHHLFSGLLFQFLRQSQPEIIPKLYERAATWLEQNGYLENAIGYALKAQNYELATRLMLQIKNNLWNRGEVHLLLNWLNTLPEELVTSQPELCLAYGGSLLLLGYFDATEKWWQLVEDSFGSINSSDPQTAIWFQKVLIYRGVNARFRGDYAAAIALGQSGLDHTPSTAVRDRGSALLFLGHTHFYAGNTDTAEQVLIDAIQSLQASGHVMACLNARHYLAQLRVLQGRLHDASEIYEQAIEYAGKQSTTVNSGVEYVGRGDLKREWNQLEAAAAEIQKGHKLAEEGGFIFTLMDVYLAGVRLALSQKDWEAAWKHIQKAEQLARRSPNSVEIDHLEAWQARLQLAQGNLDEAKSWAETVEVEMKGAKINGPFDLIHEYILFTLARIWLAQGKNNQAAGLLESVRIGAEDAGRGGRALEAQLLQALVEQASGKEKQAIDTFTQVLARAEPQGYVRLFIEEGEPVARLLYKVTTHTTIHQQDYAKRLLVACLNEVIERQPFQAKPLPGDELIEPLSQREKEVLHLMADGCSNKEIAAQLVISIGTAKRHVVHIFRKLGAANRTQAVAIARELEIV